VKRLTFFTDNEKCQNPIKMIKKNIFLLLAILFTAVSFAQEETAEPQQDLPNTIDNQFDVLIESSNNYQDYKVVRKYKINELRKNTGDTIKGLHARISNLNTEISEQDSQIVGLKDSLASTNLTLGNTREEKDSIDLFGIQMSKGGYKGLMWGIIAVLALATIFFAMRFKSSNFQTREAKHKLADTEAEYEDYRKKALEKEQKMGRLLQDERNKHIKNSKG
tara:strand:+ start:1626 stop:2288 length:663 start_codon:yes stop_codon:yes gene_type:complete